MTLTAPPAPSDAGPPSPRRRPWRWVVGIGVAAIVLAFGVGAVLMFSWMVDETRFERPTAEFDDLTTQIAAVPGVTEVDADRWVEAPTFSDPYSWITLRVDAAAFPDLLDEVCTISYPDDVMWWVRVETAAGSEVSLSASSVAAGGDRCADFGFDAPAVVEELAASVPGIDVQPSVWDDGQFALVTLEDHVDGFGHLLPLVGRTDDVRAAAGFDDGTDVEINSMTLGVTIRPGEVDGYLSLLTTLSEEHGVTSFWADSGGTPVDGVDRVQVTAPASQHEAVEALVRDSGLAIADLPARFLGE